MSSLMRLAPQKATIAESGEVVDVRDVKLKSVLSVKAGEVIPIDGIVVEGNCEVDEKTLSGETFPVTKQKDSLVWAGTINLNGNYLHITIFNYIFPNFLPQKTDNTPTSSLKHYF